MGSLDTFAAALTAADRRPPPGLAGPSDRRFAVYRNNVAVGLIRALQTRLPAVHSLVGDAFFGAMACDFIDRHPPSSPVLAQFGDELPRFLAGLEAAADMPYLPDIARIEVARTLAYHAADIPRLGAAAFTELAADAVEGVVVDLHPAVTVICSDHPVADILAVAHGRTEPVEAWQAQAVLIDRPIHDVEVVAIPTGTAMFLAELAAGTPLGRAAAQAAQDPSFEASAALAELIGRGLTTRIRLVAGDTP